MAVQLSEASWVGRVFIIVPFIFLMLGCGEKDTTSEELESLSFEKELLGCSGEFVVENSWILEVGKSLLTKGDYQRILSSLATGGFRISNIFDNRNTFQIIFNFQPAYYIGSVEPYKTNGEREAERVKNQVLSNLNNIKASKISCNQAVRAN